jgi:hypothetical protein
MSRPRELTTCTRCGYTGWNGADPLSTLPQCRCGSNRVSEVVLSPGWLKRDVDRAAARLDAWLGTHPARAAGTGK